MRAKKLAVIVAASANCCTTHAFQNHVHRHVIESPSSTAASPLCAKKKKSGGSGGGRGFGASVGNGTPKYTLDDKSYGISSGVSTPEEERALMVDFFASHEEWKPLFRHVMAGDGGATPAATAAPPPAVPVLADTPRPAELWDIATLEQRRPWRLLPPKPASNSSLAILAAFLDEWQQSLLDIPLDEVVTGDNDLHFLEEGRRTIAVTRFHVLDDGPDPGDAALFRACWSELAYLLSHDESGTGALVLLPDGAAGGEQGLDFVRDFVEHELLRPLRWLGRQEDFELAAMDRGSLAVRILYKLSDIPNLSERNSSGDENITL